MPEVTLFRRLSFAVIVARSGSQIIIIVSDTYRCPIALYTTIVYNIKRGATIERIIFYARYAVGYDDRGKRGATFKRYISYACYAVSYYDRGKRGANRECLTSYARYAV